MNKIFQYLREVKTELFKVVWPTLKETSRLTLIVIVFSVLVALFLGGVDFGLTKVLEVLVN
ncbi:MAG: preprotein translocase subunit SecE [Candidatus Doudnabacteria bacterium RIFCSPHIGHO2_01_FULL_43_23]|uniref:Protein translocase subunit SecE n=1 Tax=Candidatus Doudnabacteria bacterium RIFCSPHIGHO2_01_FULL_43_23 TaxID=1817822 RepID=A0A1F5NRI4_9BACT|nr:MAG: preprotein translocase subunit SecE [Candidatus Doudnabacteria bacterium RIFCSPHIGHO2_01_FULL_43_23]